MPIPPPQGLPPPPRQIRALRRTPLFIATGILIVVVAIIYYGITHIGATGSGSATKQAADGTAAADAGDVLRDAPSGNAIAAARAPRSAFIPAAIAAPVQLHFADATPTPPAPSVPAQPDDDMTDQAIAARKAAWNAYYKALTDQQEDRLKGAPGRNGG